MTNSARFFSHIFQLYKQGDYAAAFDLANREGSQFVHDAPRVYHLRASLASLMEDKALALRYLCEALDAGYFYADRFWTVPDLKLLFDDPEYARLRELSGERLEKAQAEAKPERRIFAPEQVSNPLPLLIALHGNNDNAAVEAEYWSAPSGADWLVALAQSSQVCMPDAYVWNDRDKAIGEVCDHYAAMSRDCSLDPNRIVLGGFSLGAETAIVMALSGLIPVCGFVAVAPGGPTVARPEQWEPLIKQAEGRGLRGYVIMGQQDHVPTQIRLMVEMFRDAGITCMLEEHADMGHEFPVDFAQRLPSILEMVVADEL